jgi:predicted Zn-dependent protease
MMSKSLSRRAGASCLLALLALSCASCGTGYSETDGATAGSASAGSASSGSGGGAHQPTPLELYGSAIKRIVIEVDYATGAEPYTGNIVVFGDTWGLFKTNAERLFQGSGKELTIPSELAQMEELTDITGAEFTGEAVLAIAAAHRNTPSEGDTATFYFVWLPGYYHDGMMVRKDVLGVSFGGTGVIGMFKPVIESSGGVGPGTNVEKYVEQATLVHEFGHAIGLVNNGLALTTPHQDEPHGAHCSNQDCVMYYAIEGTSGAIEFVNKAVTGQSSVLFAGDCLADVDAAIQKGASQ